MMAFQGTVSSYTPNPFMMTMTDGILLDKNGKPSRNLRRCITPRRAKRRPSQ